ncbi:1558_t:CDS:2 [Diversispora eburnea]|uniref:Chromosome segregation in meiosis protein n=1 Tax=Diversispora eburnea TaxID=1213867 RepID=A0A9N8YM46_9GLOM|nr:1558_t:CDS:2 [Diversispora eburnea]
MNPDPEDLLNNYDIFEETTNKNHKSNKNHKIHNNYKNIKSNKNDKVKVHTSRRRGPKLDFTMLVSDRGLKKVLDDAQKLRFEELSKNNKDQNQVTERNLNKLIGFYQAWAHDLCPKMKFHDFIQKVEILYEFEKEIEMKNPIIDLINEVEEEERDDKNKGDKRDYKEKERGDKEEERNDKEEDMIIYSQHNSTTINFINFNQNDDNNNTEENVSPMDKRDNVPPMNKSDTMDTLDAMNTMNIDDDNNSDNSNNGYNNNNYDVLSIDNFKKIMN